jgi:hypothetical protein
MILLGLLLAAAPDVAVLDLQASDDLPQGLIQGLNEKVANALQATGRFGKVLASSDLRAVLSVDQTAQALGCESEGCYASLANAFNVAMVCVAQLNRTADRLALDLKIIRMKDGQALARLRREYLFEASLTADFQASVSALGHAAFGELRPLADSLAQDQADVARTRQLRTAGMIGTGTAVALMAAANLWMANAQQDFADNTDKLGTDLDALYAVEENSRTLYLGGAILAVGSAVVWGMNR